MSDVLLTARDLSVRYAVAGGGPRPLGRMLRQSTIDVLRGISLEVAAGETLAIVGESGSGKTTLAMALCGLSPVMGGTVTLSGAEVPRDKRNQLQPDHKKISLMFQDPVGSLSPRMTVRDLLAEPYKIHGGLSEKPEQGALKLLSMVGLTAEFADRYPHQLSGGQARRVCLARALAQKPDLLIADEPTAGLDVSIQGDVLNLLARVQREMGLGIIIITHNLNIVRHVATRMAIMYLGRFVEQGTPRQIFEQPRHPYTAALLAANPSVNPSAAMERVELVGEVPGLRDRPTGCEFHPRCPRVKPQCTLRYPDQTVANADHAWSCFYPVE